MRLTRFFRLISVLMIEDARDFTGLFAEPGHLAQWMPIWFLELLQSRIDPFLVVRECHVRLALLRHELLDAVYRVEELAWEDDGAVLFGGDLIQDLQVTQLQRDRMRGDDIGCFTELGCT
jgi:hypothetical protein